MKGPATLLLNFKSFQQRRVSSISFGIGSTNWIRNFRKNCGGLIYYKPYEGPERAAEKCGNIIPELQGAKILAFDRPEE